MKIRCDKCRGKKHLAGMGMVKSEDCPKCNGLGSVEEHAEQDDVISVHEQIETTPERVYDLPLDEHFDKSKSQKNRIKNMKEDEG